MLHSFPISQLIRTYYCLATRSLTTCSGHNSEANCDIRARARPLQAHKADLCKPCNIIPLGRSCASPLRRRPRPADPYYGYVQRCPALSRYLKHLNNCPFAMVPGQLMHNNGLMLPRRLRHCEERLSPTKQSQPLITEEVRKNTTNCFPGRPGECGF